MQDAMTESPVQGWTGAPLENPEKPSWTPQSRSDNIDMS